MKSKAYFGIAVALAMVMLALPIAAQVKEEWRYLQDPRTLDELIAEYQASKGQKILIDPADDAASKALAATFKWSVAIIGWKEGVTSSFQAGSGEIVWNDELHGAGILTAAHVLRRADTGEPWIRMAVITEADSFGAIIAGRRVDIDMTKMVTHPTQDLAVIPIAEVLRDEFGEKIEPVTFYQGELAVNDVVCIGGYGRTGPVEIADTGIIPGSTFDGFRRAARLKIHRTSGALPNRFVLSYEADLQVAGQPGNGDSGGWVAIEAGGIGGVPMLCGIIVQVVNVGISLRTTVEEVRAEQLAWISSIRAESVIDPTLDSDGDGIPDVVELELSVPA